jgi:hypothetical protein
MRALANILEDILGYFAILQHLDKHQKSDLDIRYFAILQQMSGFAYRIFWYFAIS